MGWAADYALFPQSRGLRLQRLIAPLSELRIWWFVFAAAWRLWTQVEHQPRVWFHGNRSGGQLCFYIKYIFVYCLALYTFEKHVSYLSIRSDTLKQSHCCFYDNAIAFFFHLCMEQNNVLFGVNLIIEKGYSLVPYEYYLCY